MFKKMIAPIIIAILTIIYYLFFFISFISAPMPILVKVLLGIIPLGLICAMIAVVVSRIREIKGGEEDDLSKY